jgi:succinyl-CoA synthetase beta subunit
LNLLEYQSKKLLDEAGVAIQKFRLIEADNPGKVLEDFSKTFFGWNILVI